MILELDAADQQQNFEAEKAHYSMVVRIIVTAKIYKPRVNFKRKKYKKRGKIIIFFYEIQQVHQQHKILAFTAHVQCPKLLALGLAHPNRWFLAGLGCRYWEIGCQVGTLEFWGIKLKMRKNIFSHFLILQKTTKKPAIWILIFYFA